MTSSQTATSDPSVPDPKPAPGGRRSSRFWSPRLVVALVAVMVLGVLVGRQLVGVFSPHLYSGTILQGETAAPPMDGMAFARTGEPVDVAAREGKVVVVFFGYTNCPDVCPASMALAAQAVAGLSDDDQAKTDVWMVSVDPERDQPDILQQYVELFNPGFDGVGGPAEAVDRVSSGYGVFYELEPSAASGAGDYLVDHTASLFGIGPDGALRIIWPPGVTADEIRADIEELL